MKKIIAMLLCLALLTACCAAVAETAEKNNIGTLNVNGAFNIKCQIPENYSIAILNSDNSSITGIISSDDADKPTVTLSIVFNDSYTQDGKALRMNDISEEDLAAIKDSFYEQTDEVESFEEKETAFGTKLLIVKGKIGTRNYVDVYSIYNSYEVEALATINSDEEGAALTDEQEQMIIDFFSNMDFEEIK